MDLQKLIAQTVNVEDELFYPRLPRRKQPTIDWAHLSKRFPLHKKHIYRIRKNQIKLLVLKAKLEKK